MAASHLQRAPPAAELRHDLPGRLRLGRFPSLRQTDIPRPNVERLAGQGCRFNNFYVPQAVCSASRSALLSGCYPGRTKVFGAHPPRARGLDPKFATMGEVLKTAGYRTAVFGKWHIGDQPETRPPARGFDESCGLMYSNDMWEFHPEDPKACGKYPLQFWENGKVKIERVTKEHQPMLTTWYTEHAVDFIQRNKANPFLLYVRTPCRTCRSWRARSSRASRARASMAT